MTRTRPLAAALAAVGLLALAAAFWVWWRDAGPPAAALDHHLGGPVVAFDSRYSASRIESGPFRRIYALPEARLLLDLTRTERVRQVTLGRDRAVNDTRQPDPADWSLDRARALAHPFLPPDATRVRTEPFLFRDERAGDREIYRSPALARVFPPDVYAEHGALGPPGLCAVTYYQTTAGGVALILVGLL
ncbi:MAG TPA: hypothetical protein VFX49_08250 [Chloroflexota bacterium]|nr:hypothetical protein [Chloroflexota bacterium]